MACSVFFFAGYPFVRILGIQNDEALFAAGIYDPISTVADGTVFQVKIPLMLMHYLGALKCWLYSGVFRFWPPTAYSVRVPVLLLGALTVWLFFCLMRRIAGTGAALFGTALLATDSLFVLTTCLDWGPVAIQHLCMVAGWCLLARFYQQEKASLTPLAGGFFLFGLALWDKALFLWMLSGMGVGALLAFPRAVFRSLSWLRVAVAAAAMALGALPLIIYNVDSSLGTFRQNQGYTAAEIRGKAPLLKFTLEGQALFGYAVTDEPPPHPYVFLRGIEKASLALSRATGQRRVSLQLPAFVVALALFPVVCWLGPAKARAALIFSLAAGAVAWLEMAVTIGAGGSLHHTILLWPLPQMFIAVAFAAVARRAGLAGRVAMVAVGVLLSFANLLVTNEYYALIVRNGGALNFTDAVYPLADTMEHIDSRNVFAVDWGITETLRLLNRGRLPLRNAADPLYKPKLDAADTKIVRAYVETPGGVFLGHTPGNEFFEGSTARLLAVARAAGYEREMLATVADRHGRPRFEIFRFRR